MGRMRRMMMMMMMMMMGILSLAPLDPVLLAYSAWTLTKADWGEGWGWG
jgi:hypothetical protein